jgi:hypothetical protein
MYDFHQLYHYFTSFSANNLNIPAGTSLPAVDLLFLIFFHSFWNKRILNSVFLYNPKCTYTVAIKFIMWCLIQNLFFLYSCLSTLKPNTLL